MIGQVVEVVKIVEIVETVETVEGGETPNCFCYLNRIEGVRIIVLPGGFWGAVTTYLRETAKE